MRRRVVVFEDTLADRDELERTLKSEGCEVRLFDHFQPSREAASILTFNPELAIVDCVFNGQSYRGLSVIKELSELLPGIPVVVCSILDPTSDDARQICERYRDAPGFTKFLRKVPVFPRGDDLVGA